MSLFITRKAFSFQLSAFSLALAIIIGVFIISCTSPDEKQPATTGIKITLSQDKATVVLSNIPTYAIKELRADSMKAEQWKDFFAVYEEIADKEMRDFQPAIDGEYMITDSSIVFTPNKAFTPGKAYFSRCYTREILEEPEDIIEKRDLTPTDSFVEYRFKLDINSGIRPKH